MQSECKLDFVGFGESTINFQVLKDRNVHGMVYTVGSIMSVSPYEGGENLTIRVKHDSGAYHISVTAQNGDESSAIVKGNQCALLDLSGIKHWEHISLFFFKSQ